MATWSLEGDTPVLTFVDGSRLEWDARTLVGVSPPPTPEQSQVWIKFVRDVTVVCPFCGAYVDDSIEMRDAPEGNLLFVSVKARDFALDQFATLFGVEAVEIPNCLGDPIGDYSGCFKDIVRQAYDHAVSTSPVTTLPYGTPMNVDTPSGRFEMSWMATDVVEKTFVEGCQDGITPANTAHFEARRLSASSSP